MITIITGASHVGKTCMAQRLLEKYKYSYLSIDHLKMGLIRTGMTDLTPESSREDLTALLWPIVAEMIKTAVENHQNLTVDGCYVPLDWRKGFDEEYLRDIRFVCLVMSEGYINAHFADIKTHASAVEDRGEDTGLNIEAVLRENAEFMRECQINGESYTLIDREYDLTAHI